MQPAKVQKWREWKASRPDFPLTVHPRGQWAKRVRGKLRYFGPLGDPEGAVALWAHEKDHLLAGMTPPGCAHGLSVKELLAAHLADVEDRIAAGKLSPRTRGEYAVLPRFFRKASLMSLPANRLGPQQFAVLQRAIEQSGRRLSSQKAVIVSIRTVFNWGQRMGLVKGVDFGPRFTAPSINAIEAERDARAPSRFIDRDLIQAALDAASPRLTVVILLGINCGFYPSDSATIPRTRIHLDCPIPFHDFRRVKNGSRRMAALWPETVTAIRDYSDWHRHGRNTQEHCLLLTKDGRAMTAQNGSAQLSEDFKQVVALPAGVGLGSLRHTYATVIDTVPDQAMIDLTMGHASKSLQKRVYRQLNMRELPRLKVLADTVRSWLYDLP